MFVIVILLPETAIQLVAWNEWYELRKLAGALALSDVRNVIYSNKKKLIFGKKYEWNKYILAKSVSKMSKM